MRELSPPPDDPRRSVLSRPRELEADGVVDDVSVRVWGRTVSPSENGNGRNDRPIRERVYEFLAWADRNRHSLEPASERFERSTLTSEAQTEAIRLPLQCLAVYEGDRLVGVFPCSADGETNTVADCVWHPETGDIGNGATTG